MSKLSPAVDIEFLAHILGVHVDSITPDLLHDWKQRYAARAITDAHRPLRAGDVKAAIYNATVWITYAYSEGMQAGIAAERESWEHKIRNLFGIKPEATR